LVSAFAKLCAVVFKEFWLERKPDTPTYKPLIKLIIIYLLLSEFEDFAGSTISFGKNEILSTCEDAYSSHSSI